MNDNTSLRLLWRSIITCVSLAIIETGLMMAVLLVAYLVKGVMVGWASSVAGVNPIGSIINACLFSLAMRVVLGFTLMNGLLWFIIALSPLRLPLAVVCLANVSSVLAMFCLWNSQYNIFPELIGFHSFTDIFEIYKVSLLCSSISPVILMRLKWLRNLTIMQESAR